MHSLNNTSRRRRWPGSGKQPETAAILVDEQREYMP
jgi:hypothetical protein